MNAISPKEFLEQAELGATVLPETNAHYIGMQVGRFNYLCEVAGFTKPQAVRLEALYRAGRLRFGHPGDFHVAPACFRDNRLRHRVVSAARLTSVMPWTKR